MKIISACIGAAVISVIYYISVCVLDSQLKLGLNRDKYFIKSKAVWIVGIFTAFVWIFTGLYPNTMFYTNIPFIVQTMIIMWGMSVLAITDYYKKIIPNHFILMLLAIWAFVVLIGLAVNMDEGLAVLFQSLAGGIAGGVIFLLCYLISRGQLGAGDVKLAFVLGLYMTGQRIMGVLVYGILICCVYSVIQLLRKKIGMKDGVALVPFLYIGMLITLIIL